MTDSRSLPRVDTLLRWPVRHPFAAILICIALVIAGAVVAATRLGIDSDLDKLLADDLDWREREAAMDAAFPLNTRQIAIVIDASDALVADQAVTLLTEALAPAVGNTIADLYAPGADPVFRRSALLYQTPDRLNDTLDRLIAAQPILATLAADPSIRGLASAIELMLMGVERGEIPPDRIDPLLTRLDRVAIDALEGQRPVRPLDWTALAGEAGGGLASNRRFVIVRPVVDHDSLAPVAAARASIAAAIAATGLDRASFVTVRVTGDSVMAEDEFATLAEGMGLAGLLALSGVVLLLFLGLRRWRLILAITVTLIGGLVVTAGFAGLAVGALNPISIAFAVMFIGLAVDFGIQYAVRLRAEVAAIGPSPTALETTGNALLRPLLLAAAATAIGFLAFLPTDYVGVSQLGLIAGAGMVIAVALTLFLLPALIRVLGVPKEAVEGVGFAWIAPVDRIVAHRRPAVLAVAAIVFLAALAVLPRLGFDFNPINLRNPDLPSVATALDLLADPETAPLTVEVLTEDRGTAADLAARLTDLEEVGRALTIDSFVPADQATKLPMIENAAFVLGVSLTPFDVAAPPDAEAVADALGALAEGLRAIDPAKADRLQALSRAPAGQRLAAATAVSQTLPLLLDQLGAALAASPVAVEDLPGAVRARWLTEDGRARIDVNAAFALTDNRDVRRFVEAVRTVAPGATGTAVTYQESARVIVTAFVQASVLALAAIAVLLLVVLRKPGDVVRVLVPLIWAGGVTLAATVLIGLPLNFANIIALPLLLGIGVAFNIYFVVNWRRGVDRPLGSPTTRAVLFSAATTAVAFGSLMVSSHPGTASMGQLLTLALAITLVATLLLMPALLGPPPGSREPPVLGEA